MTRIPILHYLGRRDLLCICWHYVQVIYTLLPPDAQADLHRFYAPSKKLTDDEFLAHMKLAVAKDPSLPHRAGKHYKKIFDVFKRHADVVGKMEWELIRRRITIEQRHIMKDPSQTGTGKHRVVVYAVMRPEVDIQLLAKALLQLARDEDKKSRGEPIDDDLVA